MRKLLNSVRKRPLNLVLVIVVIGLYMTNNIIIKPNTDGLIHIFFVSYFNDLLCPYFFLGYANMLLITCNKEMDKLFIILLVMGIAGAVWELGAPYLKEGSVTDIGDYACYMLGAIGYWLLLKKVKNGEKADDVGD